jgi:HPr kinase/phosphorylase
VAEHETQVHGTLVEVLGVGVLIRGPSGIGKSEAALELVTRGHRLVADDVVRLREGPDGRPNGSSPPLIRHHLEIRGIGILYVPDLYGPEAVAEEAGVGLVCRLERWREGESYERVGLTRTAEMLLGRPVPSLLLPVRPAGNMATLIEVAVRDHQKRESGVVAASRLDERMRSQVGEP